MTILSFYFQTIPFFHPKIQLHRCFSTDAMSIVYKNENTNRKTAFHKSFCQKKTTTTKCLIGYQYDYDKIHNLME